jgi:pimeloyl-ACP methyl ester carboxylesterase
LVFSAMLQRPLESKSRFYAKLAHSTRGSVAVVDSVDEFAGQSEFAFLDEAARHVGVTGPLPPVQRIESGAGAVRISALRWGAVSPRVVFIHGGAQNAHTFDAVILGLGEPALAVDLPGHGRSAWRDDGDYTPQQNAATLQPVLRELAPGADLLVGMSLGGLTAIRLAAAAPELAGRLAIVDITPSALQRYSFSDATELWSDVSAITAPTTLIRGQQSPFVSDADVDEYARRTARLRVHGVPDAGHYVQNDQPGILVGLLREALP